jgi:sortase A
MLRPGRPTPQALKLLEYCCWGLGAGLLIAYLASTLWAQYGYRSALVAFEASRFGAAVASPLSGDDALPHAGLDYAPPDQSLWSIERIRRYAETRWDVPVTPEAVVRIPSLGLEVPVFPGETEANMTRGAGRITGSPRFGEPGNVSVSSHRDGFFRKLKDIRVGDAIVVDTRTATYRYVVEEIRVTEPTDTVVLWPGEVPELTLVTCYPFNFVGHAPQRYVVRAELRKE